MTRNTRTTAFLLLLVCWQAAPAQETKTADIAKDGPVQAPPPDGGTSLRCLPMRSSCHNIFASTVIEPSAAERSSTHSSGRQGTRKTIPMPGTIIEAIRWTRFRVTGPARN